MTIGEAAARLGVDTHVLRHWEQVGALTVGEMRTATASMMTMPWSRREPC
ncbi:MerR family DNA-binding transcriptional regulator [Streptomyces caelestis]